MKTFRWLNTWIIIIGEGGERVETPNCLNLVSWQQFKSSLHEHCRLRYKREGEIYRCRHCGAQVRAVLAYISIHTTLFTNCAGGGVVERVEMPYCPNCETRPESLGCVHLPPGVSTPWAVIN